MQKKFKPPYWRQNDEFAEKLRADGNELVRSISFERPYLVAHLSEEDVVQFILSLRPELEECLVRDYGM